MPCLTIQKAEDEAKKKAEQAKKKAEEAKKVSIIPCGTAIYATPLPVTFVIKPCLPATLWALRHSRQPTRPCPTSWRLERGIVLVITPSAQHNWEQRCICASLCAPQIAVRV